MNTHNVAATHLTAHLTEDQFADYVLGLSTEAMDIHIQQCAACRAEVLAVQDSIGAFASAGRAWSEAQPPSPTHNFRRRALLIQMRPVAGFAAAAAIVFGVTFSTHHNAQVEPQRATIPTTTPAAHTLEPASEPTAQASLAAFAPEAQPDQMEQIVQPASATHRPATPAELAQDNAMMAAIDAEINTPFAVSPDVGHAYISQ
ncbi:MAG: hypothetical protein JSS87_09495 [Acidobacteria bacterium]|nr:hypothetical protein [Acidobacteriota bacterium]